MKRLMFTTAVVFAFALNLLAAGAGAAEKGQKRAGKTSAIQSKDKAGKTHVAKGYVPMKAAPGAKKFQAAPKLLTGPLPPKVDLRGSMTRIENQGETSSCVANAVAGAFEYWIKRTMKLDYDVSRLFVYYNARWRNGDPDKDEGSIIQLAMEGLKEFGACSEERWPFSKPLLLEKPNRAAYQEADKSKIKEMAQVPLELEAWKQALASGYPVVFGCLLFESFDRCNQQGGVVPMPDPKDVSRESHGGHSMCAVGYSDKEQVFIVRNSWGDDWGDRGYCYMPYNYLMNPEFNDGDSWVFVPEVPLENPEDTWFTDDEPVTDGGRGVDFVINPYTVEDYEGIELTWWEEETVEYNDDAPAEYTEYVEYADADEWDSMEAFDHNAVIADWEEENPGEESSLYAYDGEDEDFEVSDEADSAEEEEVSSDEESDDGEYDDEDAEEEDAEEAYDEEEDGDYDEDEAEEEDDEEAYDEEEDGDYDEDEAEEEDDEEAYDEEEDGDYDDEEAEEEDDEEAYDEEEDGDYDEDEAEEEDDEEAYDEEEDGDYDDEEAEEEDDEEYSEDDEESYDEDEEEDYEEEDDESYDEEDEGDYEDDGGDDGGDDDE